jgi:glycosyltransferase involved in cell wall biosynthesis
MMDEPNTSGATYLRSLLREWQKLQIPPRVLLLLPRLPEESADPLFFAPCVQCVAPKRPCFPASRFLRQVEWQQWVIPALLGRHRPDVYISPFHLTPQFPLGIKMLTVIHDLCFLGDTPFSLGSILHRMQMWSACCRAQRLVCVSRFTAAVLKQWWPAVSGRAYVVHNGFLNCYMSAADAGRILGETDGGMIPDSYFLWIGTPGPRKNTVGLLDAYALYVRQGQPERTLVMVAPESTHAELREMARVRRVEGKVRLIKSIGDDTRDALYRGATALVFPSVCEGFAYPILEAMVQGCPVVAWRKSPAREIVGNSFPLVDNLAPEEIVDRMALAASLTPEGREKTAGQLIERTQHFTTKAMAEGILKLTLELV